jgi:hypothetical protein
MSATYSVDALSLALDDGALDGTVDPVAPPHAARTTVRIAKKSGRGLRIVDRV